MERTKARLQAETHRGLIRKAGWTWWVAGWLLIVSTTPLCGAPLSKEYPLKAAFIFNFTKFVEWSPQSFAGPESMIVIGVLGSSALVKDLESAVQNRKVNGRAILVKSVQSLAGAKSVHLLFVSATEDARLGDLREEFKGTHVLTVGESETFAKAGGVITFVIDGDKVRFDINATAADKASLKISAQLQKLARAVRK